MKSQSLSKRSRWLIPACCFLLVLLFDQSKLQASGPGFSHTYGWHSSNAKYPGSGGLYPMSLANENVNVDETLKAPVSLLFYRGNRLPKFQKITVHDRVSDQNIALSAEFINSNRLHKPQTVTITGKVTDENDEPLPGVTIRVKGTTTGTISQADGSYRLEVPDGAVLLFSFVGYNALETAVGNRSVVNVRLQPDVTNLNEVVVVGYGTVRKKDLTGAVSKIDAKDVQDLPASRVDQAIQGRTPGVFVTSTNGAPGSRATIRIRGGNSINAGNEPLWVVDGFIVGTGFNLNTINVNDIESIDVLKDASAISIYGTRGANGVILVTTKTGARASGVPEVTVNFYAGAEDMARKIDFLDGAQRAEFGIEGAAFSGEADPFTDPSQIGNTDWQDLVSQTGTVANMDLSVTGRTDKLNYYIAANVFEREGIIRETGIRRYGLRTNLDIQVTPKVKAGIRMNTTLIRNDNNLVDLWGMREVLTSFPVYNDDGSFNGVNPVTGGVLRNPEADLQLRTSFANRTNILATFYAEYELLEGLTFKATVGPKIYWNKSNTFLSKDLPGRVAANQGGRASIGSGHGIDILQENTLTYVKSFEGGHRLNAVAGFTWQRERNENFSASTDGLTVDVLSYDAIGAGDPLTYDISSGSGNARQIVSWLGRVNYSFNDKYFLTLAGRVDGASVYAGSNNEYAFFPSAAFAWSLIDESFISDLGLFENLKFRVSYGTAGKESIGPYRTLATLSRGSVIFDDNQVLAIRRGRPNNPDLTWETTSQFDVGLEFGLFGGRLSGEIDYYYKKTTDLLLEKQIPRATGFSTRLENVGSLQNQGIELMLNATVIDRKDFSFNTTLTLAGNRSRVLELGDVDEIIVYSLSQGGPGAKLLVDQPVGVFTGVRYLGTYKNQEEIDADGNLGIRQVVGGPRFEDTNGDGTINNDDHAIIGDPEPDFYGGFNASFTYKKLSLDLFFQGTFGNEIYNEFAQRGFFGRSTSNVYAELTDRWTEDNPNSDIPRAGSMVSISDIRSNTALVEDGSHLRLKNVRIAYDFPLKDQSFFKSLNIYATGSNVFLLSDFRGYDPEVNRLGTNSTVRGIARAEYPNARTFTLGIRAQF